VYFADVCSSSSGSDPAGPFGSAWCTARLKRSSIPQKGARIPLVVLVSGGSPGVIGAGLAVSRPARDDVAALALMGVVAKSLSPGAGIRVRPRPD
jgi:hypothetical protein